MRSIPMPSLVVATPYGELTAEILDDTPSEQEMARNRRNMANGGQQEPERGAIVHIRGIITINGIAIEISESLAWRICWYGETSKRELRPTYSYNRRTDGREMDSNAKYYRKVWDLPAYVADVLDTNYDTMLLASKIAAWNRAEKLARDAKELDAQALQKRIAASTILGTISDFLEFIALYPDAEQDHAE